VTLLVNNAGTMTGARVLGDEDPLRSELEVNYLGTVAVTRAFAPILASNGGGAVINVLSVLSWLTLPNTGGYSCAKAASWAATNALRHELHENATQVLALHAGFMDTDMTKDVEAPKSGPSDVAAQALAGLEAGEPEVLADDPARQVKAALAGPPSNLYPTVG
jgi:short-subunit dehydrogenase